VEAFVNVTVAPEVNCLLGAELQAFLNIDWRAIDAIVARCSMWSCARMQLETVVDVLSMSSAEAAEEAGPTNPL
jgi:hypothetical protein